MPHIIQQKQKQNIPTLFLVLVPRTLKSDPTYIPQPLTPKLESWGTNPCSRISL